ncbi:MAG: DUF4340 domain-containing protein [Sandaracinaceae bacterium]|nr:DUF4340 domain-containing protein [Sandaracinaceae bacterium]
MRKRTVFVLGGVALALLAFIVFYERHTIPTSEVEARKRKVLERFVRGRVHRLRVEHKGSLVVELERVEGAAETLDTFDVGTWRLLKPIEAPADPQAVDSLLLALESLSPERTIEGPSSEDRQRFGLDSPEYTVIAHVGNEVQRLRVSAKDEALKGLFVEVEGTNRLHLVGSELLDTLAKGADEYRTKKLVEDMVLRDVVRLRLEQEADGRKERAELEWSERHWVASVPFQGFARESTVNALIDALIDARIVRYLPESDAKLLASPRLVIELERKIRDKDGLDTGEIRKERIALGAACPAPQMSTSDEIKGEESIAVRLTSGALACVPAQSLARVFEAPTRLREARLLALSDDRVETISFFEGEGKTLPLLELRREGDKWVIREGEKDEAGDTQSISEWLGRLRATEVVRFEPLDEKKLQSCGLAPPRRRIRIRRNDNDQWIEEIALGGQEGDLLWVRRGQEKVLGLVARDVESLLSPSKWRFRSRELIRREADDIIRIEIERAGVGEVLTRDGENWRVEKPFEMPGDRVVTRELTRLLASLRAERWLEPGVGGQGLFERPSFRIRFTFRTLLTDAGAPLPTEYELTIGAATQGGHYARLSTESTPFVIAQQLIEQIREPLADREAIAIDTSQAKRITLRTSSGATLIEKGEDGEWRKGSELAAPDATAAFLDRLRNLRAKGAIRYSQEPLRNVELRIEVEGLNTKVLEVGRLVGEGEEAFAPVRMEGVPVEYRLAPDVFRALVSYRP